MAEFAQDCSTCNIAPMRELEIPREGEIARSAAPIDAVGELAALLQMSTAATASSDALAR